MSFFNTTARVLVKSKLPPGVTQAQGVAMLHDLDFFINCDPCLASYELLEKEVANPSIPADRVKALGPTSSWKILDVVENVPKGIWGSNVESTYEFTSVEKGLFSRIKSPLNINMETLWEVREAEDGEGLELVEEADITCSKLLVGIVKGQCETGATKIHAKMLGRLTKELEQPATNGHAG